MYLCYVDEAGCPGALPSATSNVQPVLVICGLILSQDRLRAVTRDFLNLKRQFNPGLVPPGGQSLDLARKEIKGADLRRDLRQGNRNRRRAVQGFLDRVLAMLEANDAKLLSRIYVKAPAGPFDGKAVYTATIQALCTSFQHFLTARSDYGLVIADSRTPALNSVVSHSIFTQKFRAAGDPYGRLLEMPTFGHSENHIALQITDFVCSAMLTPMATSTYCAGHINSVHVHSADGAIRQRYASRLANLGYRYHDGVRMRGGVTVNDGIGQRSPAAMFR